MKEKRCTWCLKEKIYQDYHDFEWGCPVYDDKKLFEFLTLEGAQAGLSWITILKRRKGYKKAYANWSVRKVANFDAKDIKRLLADEGIIRNKQKILASINNAQRFLEVKKEFGSFANYNWSFAPDPNKKRKIIRSMKSIPAITKESEAFSKDLKQRGFKFVGPTIVYAHMQATGMVNDHLYTCPSYKICEIEQKKEWNKFHSLAN